MIGAATVMVLSLVYLGEAWELPFGEAGAPDIGFVPKALGVLLFLLCLLLFIREWLQGARRRGQEGDEGQTAKQRERTARPGIRRVLAVTLTLLLYPLLLRYGGFLVATALMLLAVLRLVEYRSWIGSTAAALTATVAAYIIFSLLLGVYFPKGIFG